MNQLVEKVCNVLSQRLLYIELCNPPTMYTLSDACAIL